MSVLLREQLGPLLDQALDDGPEGLSLIECFALYGGELREHLYDLALFAGDDGSVYRAGTREVVASFSQGSASASDARLEAALEAGYEAWLAKREPKKVAPPSTSRLEAPEPSGAIPEYATLYAPNQFELGKTLSPRATHGLLRITKPPTPKELVTLTRYLASRAPRFVVEVGATVPLSVLEHVNGVPFVVLGPGRKSFEGLERLPASVRRLSIRKQNKLSLAGLPDSNTITSLELHVGTVPLDTPRLAHLESVGWTGAEDASWLTKQPRLREVALRNAKITKLPASGSVERLLLFKPSKLETLRGIESLSRLAFLRIDQPSGMKRLGNLAGCRALKTVAIMRAHAIADLADLESAPALEVLTVLMTQLGPEHFENLKGKLKGGGFQLKKNGQGRELLAYLGIPAVHTNLIENHFFDVD
jgi:hypothetical protein